MVLHNKIAYITNIICRDSEYNRITLYSVERMVPKI